MATLIPAIPISRGGVSFADATAVDTGTTYEFANDGRTVVFVQGDGGAVEIAVGFPAVTVPATEITVLGPYPKAVFGNDEEPRPGRQTFTVDGPANVLVLRLV